MNGLSSPAPTHKHQAVMQDWAKGKVIQVKNTYKNKWEDTKPFALLFWADNLEYRVKPESQKYRVALFKTAGTKDRFIPHITAAETDTEYFETCKGFVRWLTDWVEYDVE